MRRRGGPKSHKALANPFWSVKKDNESHDGRSVGSQLSLHGRLVVNRLPSTHVDLAEELEEISSDEEGQNHSSRKLVQYRLEAFDVGCHFSGKTPRGDIFSFFSR